MSSSLKAVAVHIQHLKNNSSVLLFACPVWLLKLTLYGLLFFNSSSKPAIFTFNM